MNEEEYEKYFKYKMKRQENFYQAFELGTFGDDLPKFAEDEVNKIVKTEWEYKKLQNNWNELKKWLEECLNEIKQNDVYDRTSYEQGQIITLESSIAKVQELEQGKDE